MQRAGRGGGRGRRREAPPAAERGQGQQNRPPGQRQQQPGAGQREAPRRQGDEGEQAGMPRDAPPARGAGGQQAARWMAAFLEEHPACPREQNLQGKIENFIDTVRTTLSSGVDLRAIYRVLQMSKDLPSGRLPSNRVANFAFEQETRGPRSNRILPSLLWAIAGQTCKNIDLLTGKIANLSRQGIFTEDQKRAGHAKANQLLRQAREVQTQNEALANFLAQHPNCQRQAMQEGEENQPGQDDIEQLLKALLSLIDQAHLSGMDVKALMRVLQMTPEPLTRPYDLYDTRVDRMSLTQNTRGRRGRSIAVEKPSLLWKLFGTYCDDPESLRRMLRFWSTALARRLNE